MVNWLKKNKPTTISLALLPIIALGGVLGTFSERKFIRPYVIAVADTTITKKLNLCERMIYDEIGAVKARAKEDREFIAKIYYYQKATLTKVQRKKAEDEMASDPMFKRFIAGN